MAGFDAATVVEPLDYTFEPHVKGVKGTIREPNDRQIADFLTGVKEIVKTLQAKLPEGFQASQDTDITSLMAAVDDLDPEVIVEFHAKMASLFAMLCSGEPSRENILKLPIRIRTVFYGWLQQEVMNPEAAPGAGSAQVVTLPRSAAG